MTPRCVGLAVSAVRNFPTDAGTSHVLRVRSGLIFCQLFPPVAVFQSAFDAKYITCGSSGEKTTGAVRSVRKSAGRTGVGAMFCTWLMRRSGRGIFPARQHLGVIGSGPPEAHAATPARC